MISLQELDQDKHVLGPLCKYGHEWKETGQSARYKHNWLCIECKRESYHRRKHIDTESRRAKNKEARLRYHIKDPKAASRSTMKYRKTRLAEDDYFALVNRIRGRVRRAFGVYTETGKIRTSQEYGIDYGAIIKHIGPCPGIRHEWHVDHILPISKFDLTDPEQVKKAFAPENHQWLPAIENIKKGNR